MTCIAFDGKTLAADKRAERAGAGHAKVTKVFKINGCLLAIAGSYDVGMQLVHWFQNGCIAEDYPALQSEDNEASLMVITPERRITHYERTPAPLIFEQEKTAMGSGRDYALAAMHLGCNARQAVEVACVFDVFCGNGVDEISFDD